LERIVVIGAGVGGLTAPALLLRAGHHVTVLEANVYPGGCASTFYHQGYRFDAGATLAGGFEPNGPHARVAEALDLAWPVSRLDPAWVVHLPDRTVTQWSGRERWREERRRAFPGTEGFWRLQEKLAEAAWEVSSRPFPWPPARLADLGALVAALRPRTLGALPYALRPVEALASGQSATPAFRVFLDAQLLISAQATAGQTNAMYGSAALNLPRRGVNQVQGGIGGLAQSLANWIRAHGGEVLYRQEATRVEARSGRAVAVHTARGLRAECDLLVANLTPWALADLLEENAPRRLQREAKTRRATWGAFTLYLGLDGAALPPDGPGHHQVVVNPAEPLGEANSVFISLSEPSDPTRAPAGMRAATLSTHTAVAGWWQLRQRDRQAYEDRKAAYCERLLSAAERALPGLRQAVRLCLPGTPVTFERFTRRPQGMVGGFPQTSLLAARGPSTGLENVWLVGDSVFPGQSTAGVTLGALRVAAAVLAASRAARPLLFPSVHASLSSGA
jgi:C-3',4' desaturase CrtD